MEDQLYLSAAVTLMMLSATGRGWWLGREGGFVGAVSDKRTETAREKKKAFMKDKPFACSRLKAIFYGCYSLKLPLCVGVGFLNNAIC